MLCGLMHINSKLGVMCFLKCFGQDEDREIEKYFGITK